MTIDSARRSVRLPDDVVSLEVIAQDGVPSALRARSATGSMPGQWALTAGARFCLPDRAASSLSADMDEARDRARLAAADMSEQLLRGGGKAALTTQRRIGTAFAAYLWMLGAMFAVGIGAFVAAVVRGFTAHDGGQVAVTAVFGGLSATSFVTVFLARPANAMGRAGPHSAWLLAIVNTYWSKLAYFTDAATIVADLDEAQKVFNRDLISYLRYTRDPHDELSPAGGDAHDGSAAATGKKTT